MGLRFAMKMLCDKIACPLDVYGFREGHGVMVSRFWTIAMLRNAAAGLLLKPVGPIIAGPKRCSDRQ